MSTPLYCLELKKPDGRSLWLYGREPVEGVNGAPSANREPVAVHSRLRWHPLRGEWVAYSSHRQNRTFLPPKEFNPLRPMESADHPTELPQGRYDVAVFDNLFPTLALSGEFQPDHHTEQAAYGKCEVVVFSKDPSVSLSTLPVWQIDLILEVWGARTQALATDSKIKAILPFENRGVEMGVTLHHPHGQIYAYPVVPPVLERENNEQRRHFEANRGEGLLAQLLHRELDERTRIVADSPTAAAFVPPFARYPYEVWVLPKRAMQSLHELTSEERRDLAATLHVVLQKYDGLWQKPMPYLMVAHQAPVNCGPQPWFHLHFELTPPLRSRERMKYLAGTELGAGLFANDCLPEETARQLAAVQVKS